MIKNIYLSSRKAPVILVRVNKTLTFSTFFSKKHSNIKFHENQTVGIELFHADRRTDTKKLIVGLAVLRTRPELLVFHKQTSFFFTSIIRTCRLV